MNLVYEQRKALLLVINILVSPDTYIHSLPLCLDRVSGLLQIERFLLIFEIAHEAARYTDDKSDTQRQPSDIRNFSDDRRSAGRGERTDNQDTLQDVINAAISCAFVPKSVDLVV